MRAVISLLVVISLLAGCGYKGPLYLPKPKPEPQRSPPPAQEPKKDDKQSQ
jgi:predicted small lipoprotein YifL